MRPIVQIIGGLLWWIPAVWHSVWSAVDWLSRFDWVATQARNHDWVADVIEGVINRPPPLGLLVSLGLLIFGILVLWYLRKSPIEDAVVPAAHVQETQKVERDTSIYDAVNFIAFGTWIHQEWHGEEAPTGRVNALGRAANLIRQAARDGKIPIWGKVGIHGTLDPIPAEYWQYAQIDFLSLLRPNANDARTELTSSAQPNVGPFNSLMTSRSAVEAEWPANQRSPK